MEHKTLMADELISSEQLDRLSQEGWGMIAVIETTVQNMRKYAFYFRREI